MKGDSQPDVVLSTVVAMLALVLAGGACRPPSTPPAATGLEAAAGEPTYHDALLDGTRVHYQDAGGGETVLVLVHGWASDHTVFRFQVEALRDRYRLLAVDLPGHGRSGEPGEPYSMDLLARGVAAVMDAAEVEKAVLVGHSNGTPVIRQFYRLYPQRTRALVVLDGSLMKTFDDATAHGMLAAFEAEDFRDRVAGFVDGMPGAGLGEELRLEIRTMALRQPQHAVVGGLRAALDPDIWRDDPIAVPLLLVLARQPAWSEEYEAYVRELAPHVDYQVMDDVSHFLMMERPQEVNSHLVELISSLDP